MAHKKQGGKAAQGKNTVGKRLGLKLNHGQEAVSGAVIIRQRGTTFHAGEGVDTGRDHTLFATRKGTVSFSKRAGRKLVSVQ